MPHTEPRDFYVNLRRSGQEGMRTALLAGPFETHTQALEMVQRASVEAERIDPRCHWDAHGTCSLPRSETNPDGKLNHLLGVVRRPPY